MSNNIPNFIIKKYPLRISDFDRYNRVLPSAVLDIFQDVAGAHATIFGMSGPELAKKGLCWMITRARYEIVKAPSLYQTITVKTWPLEARRVEFDRDFEIYDESGGLLMRGSSQWVIMDISDRQSPKLVPARNFDLGIESYLSERTFERAFPRANYSDVKCDSPFICHSFYTDLDMNGHVNNIKYATFSLNAIAHELSENTQITGLRIDYAKEVLEGAELRIHHTAEDNADGTRNFICRGETDACPYHFGVRFTASLTGGQ